MDEDILNDGYDTEKVCRRANKLVGWLTTCPSAFGTRSTIAYRCSRLVYGRTSPASRRSFSVKLLARALTILLIECGGAFFNDETAWPRGK